VVPVFGSFSPSTFVDEAVGLGVVDGAAASTETVGVALAVGGVLLCVGVGVAGGAEVGGAVRGAVVGVTLGVGVVGVIVGVGVLGGQVGSGSQLVIVGVEVWVGIWVEDSVGVG
jgi:hypothetical protein